MDQHIETTSSSSQADSHKLARRVYVGNLLYSVTPQELSGMLETNGLGNYEKIHLSIDPVSGRNPGYCFVEFPDAAIADAALQSLTGVKIRNRQLKVGPCQPKKETAEGQQSTGYRPTFQRWGDWRGEGNAESAGATQGPYAALSHLHDYQRTSASGAPERRLYIGGLGKMINQEENDKEIRELLSDFNV